jgi:hypothetical protein
MVKHCALTNVDSDRGFESWPGYEVKPPDCQSSLLRCTDKGNWIFQPPAAYLGDEQMLRILGRGRSVPTVTELIFVRAQCLTIVLFKHFALRGTINWIQLIVPRGARCFYSSMVKHCALTEREREREPHKHTTCTETLCVCGGGVWEKQMEGGASQWQRG